MTYFATYKAHGTQYTTKQFDTLTACELSVFGQASAPPRDSVKFYQLEKDSTG